MLKVHGDRVTITALAKINLALHVTGQRADGYHELDSIVAFAALDDEVGDRLAITFAAQPDQATSPTLSLTGPFAHLVPSGPSNLVIRAADAVGAIAAIGLEKNLPVAAGIGGGSGDAAAVLRAAATRNHVPLENFHTRALGLGADVPVCLYQRAARMGGIGDKLTPITLPAVPIVLVNPRIEVGTAQVFGALRCKTNDPLGDWPVCATPGDLARALIARRNDLEAPARMLAPAIGAVVDALSATAGCLLTRMSGSGATVCGLFADRQAQTTAADVLQNAHPGWWIRRATIRSSSDKND